MAEALAFTDFSFAYPDCEPVIGPLTWGFEEGSFTLLTGSTGSGKTTLLRCCKPEIAPVGERTGRIEVFGQDIASLEGSASAQAIGYVAQNPETQIVCDTVWHEMAFSLENLGFPQDVMRRRIAEVAHFFGIEGWFRQETASLSGGQKQLLNVASVLALRPRILLLDEPTSQLDPVAEKDFLHMLFRVNRELGLTVVVATHRAATMRAYATDCVHLADGQLAKGAVVQSTGTTAYSRATQPGLRADSGESIAVRDVFVRYAREDPFVLRGLDLAISQGRVHALVGGNGCGKSTLLKLIGGQLKPQRGKVVNPWSKAQAYLPQNPKALFVRDSVDEELAEWQASSGYTDEDIARVLGRFGLTGMGDRHPYDLSGGQQQLLAFAKLALTRPRLYLLDEPTKGLDDAARSTLLAELSAERERGATVVLATHDMEAVAAFADEVSLLFDGEIACTQTAPDFFADSLTYRTMAEMGADGERLAGIADGTR